MRRYLGSPCRRGSAVRKRIVVNAELIETRVGVQEGNLLTELYVERHRHRSIVGSVYKGVVTNVLPGMQAAFVDIGLQKDAFLYAGDFTTNLGDFARVMLSGGDEEGDADVDVEELEPRRETVPIEELLRKGQAVLVQVSKEPLGTKGARITAFISLPGRYLVYMPQARHIGVSRRIRDERERDRLRAALRAIPLPPGGFILRTNAEGKGEAEFANDIEFLSRLWAQIQARFESAAAPAALHEEGDLTFRVVRDLLSPDVDEFVVDAKEVYDKCLGYVETLVPALAERVRLHEDRQPVFEAFGVEKDIEKALRRRVWLKSGGYIVIDHTVLKINLEAVGEVVRQIRLRDLGGIIIIDFIDMEREEHREQVFMALKRALAEDKARTNVLQISELGLVEMTRKRVRQDLRALLSMQCPPCRGSGVMRAEATLAEQIFRAVRAKAVAPGAPPGREVVVRVHPDVARYLEGDGAQAVERLGAIIDRKVTVQAVPNQPDREAYEVRVRTGGVDAVQ